MDKRKKLSRALLALPGAVSFDALDDAQLTRWIGQTLRPMGKRMDRAACEALAFTSGRDLTLLHGELEKLASYAGEREEITAPDAEQRIGILAMITRHYRQMMHRCAMQAQRVPQAQAAKTLGIPPFALTRLSRQVGRRSYDALKASVSLCVQTDYDIKRGALREDAALERLMLLLAGEK